MPSAPREDEEREEDRTAIRKVAEVPTSTRRDRVHLIALAGENLGQMFRIDRRETVIGRAADSDIRVQDDGVSRRHAKIVQAGAELWIEDVNSANGTFVNNEPIHGQHILRDGDKIQMGSTTILRFTYADELEETFQQRMYDAALLDALTTACNKRHFLDRLPIEVSYAKRHGAPLSLLMLDVDHFKDVNDHHGHLAGDYVLATLGQIIRGALRTEDLFARYGGEEFAVLCRSVTIGNAQVLAERLRIKVEAFPFEHQGGRIPVTISAGVASWCDVPESATRLIADADAALYRAKCGGRNRVVADT